MKKRNWRQRGHILRDDIRLRIELLESRNLLAVMRIVDWNTLNGPNDATGDANFSTVFQAIGNETVQGNAQPISILALQETDPPGPGNDSIGRIDSIMNSLYPQANYQFYVTPVDGGGDSTGFVYDTTSVSLLEAVQVGAGTLTHNVSRGKFRPDGTAGESDFYVYSVHLKSGDTGADATLRGSEAAFLRADADALGEGANVLFVGDFNMQGSSEAAYSAFVSAGAGQLQDVANAPGAWNNNPAFKSLHTQDPRTAMDDRFDIQFASGELFNGAGLDYVSNSYHVFGNNGTHTFDMPITTGAGASADVLNALVAASDHLPVVADYQIVTSAPNVRITQALGGTKVVEGGLYDTYHIVLDTVPAADVTVTVTPDAQVDVGNGGGVAKAFTFTPANALTPQTVVVHAVDDTVGEGDHSGIITHTSASSDINYNGLTVASVNVAIVDNDAPKIVINELDADQTGTDAAEFVELYDGGVGNFALDGYLLVFFNGNDNNNGSYKSVNLAGQHTNANGFFVLGDSGMIPTPDLAFTGAATNQIQQGPDGIGLYKYSAAELAITPNPFPTDTSPTTSHLQDAIVYTTGPGGTAIDQDLIDALNPGHAQINENQNGGTSGDTQSLSRVPDGGTPRDTSQYVAQTPTPGTFNTTYPYGVEILQSNSRVDVVEGGATDSYQIALLSIPTANVQITVDPDNQADLGAGAGAAIVLTFTPANALIPQTIAVAAVDDMVVEGTHTSTITHSVSSADSRYNSLVISNVIARIVDNDVHVPGDYNTNGVADAADYVIWRATLGSTTDLHADGSGPTPGVPNGVVDQFDYTFWRANFGSVGGAGSGEGTGAVSSASGALAAASALPVTSTGSALSDNSPANSAAVTDAAVSALYSPTPTPRITNQLRPAVHGDSTQSESFGLASPLNLLQSANRKTRHDADGTTLPHQESREMNGDTCDELFTEIAGVRFKLAI